MGRKITNCGATTVEKPATWDETKYADYVEAGLFVDLLLLFRNSK